MHHISVGNWFHIDFPPVITFLFQKKKNSWRSGGDTQRL